MRCAAARYSEVRSGVPFAPRATVIVHGAEQRDGQRKSASWSSVCLLPLPATETALLSYTTTTTTHTPSPSRAPISHLRYSQKEYRKNGDTAGTTDTYYFNPDGQRFRSRPQAGIRFWFRVDYVLGLGGLGFGVGWIRFWDCVLRDISLGWHWVWVR